MGVAHLVEHWGNEQQSENEELGYLIAGTIYDIGQVFLLNLDAENRATND